MLNNVVSVVIPAFNEEKTIGRVIEETIQVMESLGLPYEIIVVDDGSEDRTWEEASKYKVTVLSNGRNRGKGYALRKGFQHASGDIIVTMDADGSHKPKEIPELLNALIEGADIAAGSRFLGKNENHTSKLHVFGNYLINLTWNYTDTQLRPGEQICLVLTLKVSVDLEFINYIINNDVKQFSFVITIKPREPS